MKKLKQKPKPKLKKPKLTPLEKAARSLGKELAAVIGPVFAKFARTTDEAATELEALAAKEDLDDHARAVGIDRVSKLLEKLAELVPALRDPVTPEVEAAIEKTADEAIRVVRR